MCEHHARLVPPYLANELARLDHRGAMGLPPNLDTLDRLDTLARVLESIADQEGRSIDDRWNGYRFRFNQLQRALEIGAKAPGRRPEPAAAAQAELFDAPESPRRGPWE